MLLPVAKVTKLFGAERGGGVVVALYTEFPEDFAPESEPLFVRIDSLDVPLWCERFERRGAAGALAEFADWDTARRASELVGRDSEANPLLGVTIDGREYLVPAVGEFIAGIDFEGRRLRMTLPEGLLSLND